jgi:hypothetical protein
MREIYVRTVCKNCANKRERNNDCQTEICTGVLPLVDPVTGEVLTEQDRHRYDQAPYQIRMDEFYHNDDHECRWFSGELLPKILKLYDASLGRQDD